MREKLAALYGQTRCFTALFKGYSKTPGGSNVACLLQVRLDEEELTDHVWIHRSKQMKNLGLNFGDKVQFYATVDRYVKGEPTLLNPQVEYDYKLEKIHGMIVVWRWKGGEDG